MGLQAEEANAGISQQGETTEHPYAESAINDPDSLAQGVLARKLAVYGISDEPEEYISTFGITEFIVDEIHVAVANGSDCGEDAGPNQCCNVIEQVEWHMEIHYLNAQGLASIGAAPVDPGGTDGSFYHAHPRYATVAGLLVHEQAHVAQFEAIMSEALEQYAAQVASESLEFSREELQELIGDLLGRDERRRLRRRVMARFRSEYAPTAEQREAGFQPDDYGEPDAVAAERAEYARSP